MDASSCVIVCVNVYVCVCVCVYMSKFYVFFASTYCQFFVIFFKVVMCLLPLSACLQMCALRSSLSLLHLAYHSFLHSYL